MKSIAVQFETTKTHTLLIPLQHNWVSRRADQGPKTIEQIHKEAKIEEQEEQRKVHQQLLSKENKRRGGQPHPSLLTLLVWLPATFAWL